MIHTKRVPLVKATMNEDRQIEIENPDYDDVFYEPIPESLNFNPLKQLFKKDINPTN